MSAADGWELLQQRCYRDALAVLEAAPEGEGLLERGQALSQLGRYREATEVLRRALLHGEPREPVRYHLARAYLASGRYARARKQLELVLQRPGDPRLRALALGDLAALEAVRVRPDAAEARLAEALDAAEDPATRARVLCSVSYVRCDAADYAGAEESACEALVLAPDDPLARYRYAEARRGAQNLEGAAACLAAAVELDPQGIHLRGALAAVLMRRQEWAAAAHLRAVLEISSRCDHAAWYARTLGDCLYEEGATAGAIAAYEAAAPRGSSTSRGARLAAALRAHPDRPRTRLRNVPPLRQQGNGCAACALAMVLSGCGEPVTQQELFPDAWEAGVPKSRLVEIARERGFAAEMAFGSVDLLRACLERGIPVLTSVGDPSSYHCHVVVGFDEARDAFEIQETDGRPIDVYPAAE